jgi:enamine deaminase RidA (YjgF/YER057c/UK114 family)
LRNFAKALAFSVILPLPIQAQATKLGDETMAKAAKKATKKPAKKAVKKIAKAAPKKAASKRSTITRIEAGKRMSSAVVHDGRVFLAGQVAEANAGKSVGAQTREILATIDKLLKKAGTDKTRILSANIWLSDISTFDEMNAEWDKWIVAGQTPARATVESKLAGPEYKVEIMLTAAL